MLHIKIERYESYIGFATRNFDAVYFYRGLGYDALNTITIRTYFHLEQLEQISKEYVLKQDFVVRRIKRKIAIKQYKNI